MTDPRASRTSVTPYGYRGYGYGGKSSVPTRRLSWRWLLGSLLALVIAVPSIYVWHSYQLQRVADAMLQRAEALEQEGEYRKASDYLFRCLQLSHQDSDQHRQLTARIAESYDRSATADQRSVISWYQRAVAAVTETKRNNELRTRLAELYMQAGEYQLAKAQVKQITEATPRSRRIVPLCRYREYLLGVLQARPETIVSELETLQQPGSIQLATALARLNREHLPPRDGVDRIADADSVVDAMVRNAAQHALSNDESASLRRASSDDVSREDAYQAAAYLARYEYQLEYGERPNGHDVQSALQLAPRDPDVLLASARCAREAKDWNVAIKQYDQLLQSPLLLDSQRSRGYLGLGEAYQRSGDTESAIAKWEEGIGSVRFGQLPMLVRLVETLISDQQLDKAARRLKQLDQAVARLEMVGQQASRQWATASRDLCRSRLLMARGEFSEAAKLLDRVSLNAPQRTGVHTEESLPFVASMLKGQCLLELHQWPAAANSFEQALEFSSQSTTARIWAAKAWSASGRDRAAIELCEQIAAGKHVPENVWLMLGQLLLRDQLRLPPGQRNWRRLKQVLTDAERVLPDSWEIPLVRANLLLVQDGRDAVGQVLQILASTESAHRDSETLWSNLVFMYDRMQLPQQADRALEHLESLQPNAIKSRAWRIALLAKRGELESAKKLLEFVSAGQKSEEDQVWIDRSRLFLAYQVGDLKRVNDVLSDMQTRYPENLEVLVQLADLALTAGDLESLDKTRAQLRKIEGEDGIWWRWLEIRRFISDKDSLVAEDWQRINSRFEELRRLRPWWAGTSMVQGLIAEAQGRQRDASAAFAKTVEAGFTQPEVYERLARSLYAEGRFDEAGQWLLQLQQQQPLDVRLLDIAWSSAKQQNQTTWATRLAQENLQRHPDDPLAHVWLAQIRLMNGDRVEADRLVETARELKPENVAPWAAMLSYYLQTGQPTPASECLTILESHDDLPAGERALLAAQAYAQMGRARMARERFEEAIDLLPDSVEALVLYAEFERVYDPAKALRLIRQAKERAPENDRARRLLAGWSIYESDSDAQSQIEEILRPNDETGRTANSDKRLAASLLIRQGRTEDLIRAQELLEELVQLETVSEEDQFVLAYLYERTENVEAAEQQFLALVKKAKPSARSLAAYVDFLLRRRDLDGAQTQLLRLERQAPMSLSAVSLRSRMFLAKGQDNLIDVHLETFARRRLDSLDEPSERSQALRQVSQLFEAVKRYDGAERWYRRLAAEFPQHNADLAAFLMRRNQTEEAIRFATEKVEQELTADTAALYAEVVLHANRDTTDWQQVETFLKEAYQLHRQNAKVLFALASLRLKQGKTDEAVVLLRELTERHPQHVTGWNNLAAILADDPNQLDDALLCVNRAIASVGRPIANLLDTKAVILLRRNDNEAAAELMQRVLSLPQAVDPRFQFHLAVARKRLGRNEEAKRAWLRAIEMGLFKTYLTSYEKELAAQLAQAFGTDPGGQATTTPSSLPKRHRLFASTPLIRYSKVVRR